MKNLFTLLFTLFLLNTYAADIYVFPGGTSPNYSSIHDAVNAASDGDRILVALGTYIENVEVPPIDLTIAPLIDGENYTISGSFKVTATYDGKVLTVIGAIVQGDYEEVNNTTSSCSGPQINEVNIISCEFIQNFIPGQCMITNLYYSTIHMPENANTMSKEIIGNHFINVSSTYKEFESRTISSNFGTACGILYGDDKVQKIYGNHFENVKYKQGSVSGNSLWTEDVHIANNWFEMSASTNGQQFLYISGPYYLSMSYLIENNSFSKNYSSSSQLSGWGVYISAEQSSAVIRNNAFYSNTWNNSYQCFQFSMNQGIAVVTNNLFNNSTWSSSITTSNFSNISNSYFSGNLSGGSLAANDNYFTTGFTTSQIASNSGIVSNSQAINKGLDVMDCRDIDDTRNDIGTYGGPHSWDNYHSTSSGKGRIIDLDIPSTIYGLPGVSFEVKSKAIRKN